MGNVLEIELSFFEQDEFFEEVVLAKYETKEAKEAVRQMFEAGDSNYRRSYLERYYLIRTDNTIDYYSSPMTDVIIMVHTGGSENHVPSFYQLQDRNGNKVIAAKTELSIGDEVVVLDGELKKDSYLLSNSDGNYVKGTVEKIRQEGQGNARIKTSFMGGH
jgi:hypothetical protein